MYQLKEKLSLGKGLLFCSYGFVYAAFGFSVVSDGCNQELWRKTLLQTLIFFSFFFYVISRQISGKRLIDRSSMDREILLLLFYVIGVSFFAMNKAIAVNSVIQFLSCICGFYVFISMAKNRKEQTRLIGIITIITLLLCISGLMIHFGIFLLPGWRFQNFFQRGMLCSTFANHNHMAGWLEMAILLVTGLFFIKKRSLPISALMICILAVMTLTQILTLSRGGWIATVSGGIFILMTCIFSRRFNVPKNNLAIIAGIIFILLMGALGSTPVVKRSLTMVELETESDRFSSRLLIWKGTLEMIKVHPWKGVGPGNHNLILPQFQPPGLKKRFYETHNDYLQFTAEMGVFFIPLMVWIVISFFKAGFKKLSHPSRQTRWITLGAMGGIVAILVHSVSDFNLQLPSNALLFTLLAAQVVAPAPELKNNREEA